MTKNMNRTENIMFRITPELKKRLDWLSSREGISLNEWLNRKIEPITKDEIVRLIKRNAA
jgi:predicted HicB family RNase H-like nuclease